MINNIDNYILDYFDKNIINNKIKEILVYCIESGGKRFRPKLFLSLFKDDFEKYLDIAWAIELTHTYSLIHDDLPSMDNDLMRRGKKSVWNKFGESNAILVGDALISISYDLIINNDYLSDSIKIKLISELSKRSGVNGMILGQYIDVNNYAKSKHDLDLMYKKKTGEMIGLCFSMFAIISNNNLNEYYMIGENLGLIFQYQDDILELGDSFEKNNSDIRNDKTTANDIYDNPISQINILSENLRESYNSLNLSDKSIQIIEKILKRSNNV